MTHMTRRNAILSTGAALVGSPLATPAIAAGRNQINARVTNSLNFIDANLPRYAPLLDSSAAVILIPRITAGGFFFGGSYGEGALLIKRDIKAYYSYAQANVGFQIGLQQYASALFLRDQSTFERFSRRRGWTLGADLEFTVLKDGENVDLDTSTIADDIYGLIFSKKGVLFGITLDGAKYTRIVR